MVFVKNIDDIREAIKARDFDRAAELLRLIFPDPAEDDTLHLLESRWKSPDLRSGRLNDSEREARFVGIVEDFLALVSEFERSRDNASVTGQQRFDFAAMGSSKQRQLTLAKARRKKLLVEGSDTSEVDREIILLRRAFRQEPLPKRGIFSGGRYELIEELGYGAYAKVWKALDNQRDEIVAVKILHSQWTQDRSHIDRFYSGAKHLARFNHPNIVRVLAERQEDPQFHYFVMEYLGGGDLRKIVIDKRLSTERALNGMCQVAAAVEYIHDAGMVHRDIKPHNVVFDSTDKPKLTDFDLLLDPASTQGTRTGGIGTFIYAAPEMMTHAKHAQPASDIYSLAMTTAFVVYGADLPPFAFTNSKDFVLALKCSKAIKSILIRGLEEEPSQRFLSAKAFRLELEHAISPQIQAAALALAQVPTFNSSVELAPLPQDAEARRELLHRLKTATIPGTDTAETLVAYATRTHDQTVQKAALAGLVRVGDARCVCGVGQRLLDNWGTSAIERTIRACAELHPVGGTVLLAATLFYDNRFISEKLKAIQRVLARTDVASLQRIPSTEDMFEIYGDPRATAKWARKMSQCGSEDLRHGIVFGAQYPGTAGHQASHMGNFLPSEIRSALAYVESRIDGISAIFAQHLARRRIVGGLDNG